MPQVSIVFYSEGAFQGNNSCTPSNSSRTYPLQTTPQRWKEQPPYWLQCAFLDEFPDFFVVPCTFNHDTVEDIRKKICNLYRRKLASINAGSLILYTLTRPVGDTITRENLLLLDSFKKISSSYPQSKDSEIDIIVSWPLEQQLKQQFNLPGSPKLDPQRNICPRDETVSKLAEMVDEYSIVHVRGTPSTGKTVLSLLLRDYFRKQGRTIVWIDGKKQNVEALGAGYGWSNLFRLLQSPYPIDFGHENAIILDEAQATYSDSDLWNTALKFVQGGEYRIKLCLFASSGNPSSYGGLLYCWQPVDFVRVNITPSQRVGLTPSGERGLLIGLFYTRDEFEMIVTKLCTPERYSIDGNARSYIFNLTNGHPGAVSSIVYYLFKFYFSRVKPATITEDCVVQSLADDNELFDSLEGIEVSRSFPSQDLTPEAENTLTTALEDGYVEFDESSAGFRSCYENGWIHREDLRFSVNLESKIVDEIVDACVLPSPLHKKYVEHLINKKRRTLPVRLK